MERSNSTRELTYLPRSGINSALVQILLVILCGILAAKSWKSSFQKATTQQSLLSIPLVSGFSLIGFFLEYISKYNEGFLQFCEKWFGEYGQTFRLPAFGKNIVFTSDPNLFQKILRSTESGHLEKPKRLCHRFLKDTPMINGILVSDVETWKPHRQILSKVYTHGNLKLYTGTINKYAEEMVSDLKVGKETLSQLIHSYTLQAIGYLTTGQDQGFSDSKVDDILNKINKGMNIMATRVNPLLGRDLIWNFHPKRKQVIRLSKDVEEMLTKEFILPARMEKKSHCGFKNSLELMIEEGWNDGEILSELLTLILAGHETTSISIILLLFQLALNQQHQQRCRDEVDALFERMRVEERDEILMEDTSELKYLERCIKEGLRLYPAVPGFARELKSSIKIDKFEFEKGTIVVIFPWMVHRNEEYFANPEKFDPDRFLSENCKSRHPYVYTPFSTGPRNCIGWRLAMLEITIFSAWILRHFEVFTEDDVKDINIRFRITLETEKEVGFRLKQRL